MSKQDPFVVALRATPEYRKALGKLLKAARKAGLEVTTNHQLADAALAELAARLGITLPRRTRPVGTNRFGEPREKTSDNSGVAS